MPDATINTLAKQLQVDPEEISALIDQIAEDGEPFVSPLPRVVYYDLPLTDSAVQIITDQITSTAAETRKAQRSVFYCDTCRRVWDLDDIYQYDHAHTLALVARDKLDADLR